MSDRFCKCGCGKSIMDKHPNARFFNQKHKDAYWNKTNPRGIRAFQVTDRCFYYDDTFERHPFDLEQ